MAVFTVHYFATYCTAVQFLELQCSAALCIKEGSQCNASQPSLATAAVAAVARHQPAIRSAEGKHATKLRESDQQKRKTKDTISTESMNT